MESLDPAAGVPDITPARLIERVRTRVRGRNAPRDRGAALVEFALVFPLLALLIFGTLDFGYMINRDTLVVNATKEGAREGAVNPVAADIEAVVRAALAELDQSSLTVSTMCRKADGTACPSFNAHAESGGVVIVRVDYDYRWFSFIPNALGLGETKTLSKTIEARIE